MTESFLATDAASGAVVLSGVDERRAGRRLRPADPAQPRPPRRPAAPGKDWSNSSAAASARPASTSRTPTARRCGSTATAAVRRRSRPGPYFSAAVCAGPAGRLWVAWGDATGASYVTRSNRAANAFEPVQKLQAPRAPALTFLQCEGSAGPADLFAAGQQTAASRTHTFSRATRAARAGDAGRR